MSLFIPSSLSYVRVVAFGLCFVKYLNPGCYEHYIKYWITIEKIHFSGKHLCQTKLPSYLKFVSSYLFGWSLKIRKYGNDFIVPGYSLIEKFPSEQYLLVNNKSLEGSSIYLYFLAHLSFQQQSNIKQTLLKFSSLNMSKQTKWSLQFP